ncbi:MAG: hypothetical protein ACTSRS_07565 [Candidatus Helarchaeota archaeon]
MLGNISDEEANSLLKQISFNVRENLMGRSVVETPLFPVSHYIHTATYILYDQSYQYKVSKEIAKVISPEEIARRNKTLATFLNQLAFNSFAMLYCHGRAQKIFDNIQRKKKGENIEVEPEEKKQETKFILDFWKRLSPNYRNDGKLTVEDGTIRILPQDMIDTLRSEMIPVENKPDIIKKIKRTTASLTSRNFLAMAECRAGIFEQGPYETGNPNETLIFKEFVMLYTGETPLNLDELAVDIEALMPMVTHIKTKAVAPVDNIIFGMTLKQMNKLEFNDWGTMFSDPSDFSSNITSIGLWTRETFHPKLLRYPDNLGTIKKLPLDILEPLQKYAQDALNEMYVEIATWDYLKKLMTGVNVYANSIVALFALYAGIEDKFDWTWPLDVLANEQRSDLINTQEVRQYIKYLEKYPQGVHPFLSRFFRSKKKRKVDPSYYLLQE